MQTTHNQTFERVLEQRADIELVADRRRAGYLIRGIVADPSVMNVYWTLC